MHTQPFDVSVVGAGPSGLFAATLASLHGMRVQLFESLPHLGGQLSTLYAEKVIYDVAGFPAIRGEDLAAALARQAQTYEPTIHLNATVLRIDADGEGFIIESTAGASFSRTMLLTIGIGAFTPRKLTASGAAALEGRGLHYLLPPFEDFQGQRVLVVGGGDTALDWVNALAPVAEQVTLVHRRNVFRAQEESLRQARRRPNVVIRTPYEVEALEGTAEHGIQVLLGSREGDGSAPSFEVDSVVSGLGYQSQLGPARQWDLALAGNTIRVDSATMMTSRPGIYAAGDVASYPGKVKLIASGFGEVAVAVAQIRAALNPKATPHLPHSTTLRR